MGTSISQAFLKTANVLSEKKSALEAIFARSKPVPRRRLTGEYLLEMKDFFGRLAGR
jgi:hypothetical protein